MVEKNSSVGRRKNGRVDIHCHILPGLDDGPNTLAESLAMAAEAAADGVTDIIATPHYHHDAFTFSTQNHRQAHADLSQAVREAGIPVRIHAGAEVFADPDIVSELKNGNLPKLANNSHMLLELPFDTSPVFLQELIFKIQLTGTAVVIAHPERHSLIQAEPEKLATLINQGCLAQINAASLTGELGRNCKETAFALLKRNLATIIGSDAHRADPGRPRLTAAAAAAAECLDAEQAEKLVGETPRRLLMKSSPPNFQNQ